MSPWDLDTAEYFVQPPPGMCHVSGSPLTHEESDIAQVTRASLTMPGHLRVTGDSANVAPAATLSFVTFFSERLCNEKTMPRMDIVELTLQPGYIKT